MFISLTSSDGAFAVCVPGVVEANTGKVLHHSVICLEGEAHVTTVTRIHCDPWRQREETPTLSEFEFSQTLRQGPEVK